MANKKETFQKSVSIHSKSGVTRHDHGGGRDVQITALNNDCPFEFCAAGTGGGEGEGAALQGSNPSSYTELASGFSSTKLPPKPFRFVDPDP